MTLTEQIGNGCGVFEFEMAGPFFSQICEDFEQLTPVPLDALNLANVRETPGVYGLHHSGKMVYVGKADDSVRDRLNKHLRQLTGRLGITPTEVSFRCLHFAHTWDPFQPEAQMIERYKPAWNYTGFGPNDPGHNRDKTILKDNHWHVIYPLDCDYNCSLIPNGSYNIFDLLKRIAKDAPYWVRFQGNRPGKTAEEKLLFRAAQADFSSSSQVVVLDGNKTVKSLMSLCVQALPQPNEWQLTQLPSHILLYREKGEIYPRMNKLWP